MKRPLHNIVPLALIVLLPIPALLMADDPRAIPVGIAFYGVALLIWFLARQLPFNELRFGAAGGAVGLGLAFLASPTVYAIADSPTGQAVLSLALTLGGFIVGAGLAIEKRREAELGAETSAHGDVLVETSTAKICDTSVLIDGRIAEMAAAGFIDGDLVIPQFVLRELQGIADSSDMLKRNRGRRGLDIVKRLQDIPDVGVKIAEDDFRDEPEVDHKLIRLAEKTGAALLTNDFNLNKVARVRSIKVLNINDLVNALKTILLPGEILPVTIVKEGKEPGQGVGYLDDGTMVVVDAAGASLGEGVNVIVTNIHQTTAGRMIFAKYEESNRGGVTPSRTV